MKEYIKPGITVITLNTETNILAASPLDTHSNQENPNQRVQRYGIYEDFDDEEDF